VSARLTIAAYENAVSAAELRMLMNGASKTSVRITDLIGVIPAINGKIELVYEGETEGVANVAKSLLSSAIRTLFVELFPNPKRLKKQKEPFPYQPIIDWFSNNQSLELPYNLSEENYKDLLNNITGLSTLADKNMPKKTSNKLLFMEFILHGMAEYSLIHKMWMSDKMGFGDLVGDLISGLDFESE
jgi:magnesium chelatase subunit I